MLSTRIFLQNSIGYEPVTGAFNFLIQLVVIEILYVTGRIIVPIAVHVS